MVQDNSTVIGQRYHFILFVHERHLLGRKLYFMLKYKLVIVHLYINSLWLIYMIIYGIMGTSNELTLYMSCRNERK